MRYCAAPESSGTNRIPMKLFFDLFPIIAFFVVFKFVGPPPGIYYATATAIVCAAVLTLITWLRERKFHRQQLIMLVVLVVLGGATLLFHDETFIKWKPTVVSWVMAAAFLLSQFAGKRPLVERMFGETLTAPAPIWRRLNLSWVVYFIVMGGLNLYVAFNFSTDVWVNFKLFGTLGMTFAFAIIQAFVLMRYDTSATQESGD